MRAQAKVNKLSSAGKLWDDENFSSMKMDPICKKIEESLEKEDNEQPVRVIRLWHER
jgi:hypothetical protein